MKSLARVLILASVVLGDFALQVNASVLLTSFEFAIMGGAGPSPLGPVQFYLGIDGPPPTYCVPVGRGLAWWSDGESGSYDITPTNEATFGEFSSILTNGINDHLMLLTGIQGTEGDGGTVRTEAGLFPTGHDLIGNQLDFVRLDVSNVHIWTIDPDLQWQGWSADVTYEFWGEPIPEPATALLLLPALVFMWKKR